MTELGGRLESDVEEGSLNSHTCAAQPAPCGRRCASRAFEELEGASELGREQSASAGPPRGVRDCRGLVRD